MGLRDAVEAIKLLVHLMVLPHPLNVDDCLLAVLSDGHRIVRVHIYGGYVISVPKRISKKLPTRLLFRPNLAKK